MKRHSQRWREMKKVGRRRFIVKIEWPIRRKQSQFRWRVRGWEDENDYHDPEEYDEEEAGIVELENSLQKIYIVVPVEEEKECVPELLAEIVCKQALFPLSSKVCFLCSSWMPNLEAMVSSPFFIHMHSQSSRDLSGVFFHSSRSD